jgi:hypothetical protein
MSRRTETIRGILGPMEYSTDMRPEMQVSLGSFSETPLGALITLILQFLLIAIFVIPPFAIAGFILSLAF